MAKHLSPHDRLVRSLMTKPKVVQEFFGNYLPVHIKKHVKLDSISLQKESFIDDKLRMQITDLLYTAQFGHKQGYLYLLVEHQSNPDKLMAFRILKYMVAVFDHHWKEKGEFDEDLEEYRMVTKHERVEVPYDFMHVTPPCKAPDVVAKSAVGSARSGNAIGLAALRSRAP